MKTTNSFKGRLPIPFCRKKKKKTDKLNESNPRIMSYGPVDINYETLRAEREKNGVVLVCVYVVYHFNT